MPTTVYFATNRVVTGDGTAVTDYTDNMIAANDTADMTYGVAFLTDAIPSADSVGAITNINSITQGQFAAAVTDDLSHPARDLLVFIHGFDNDFENAITRAAYNQQWLAASGKDFTMIAFSWPSLGKLIDSVVLTEAYFQDQTAAGNSAHHLKAFLQTLAPILQITHEQGFKVNLLSHSMGNYALGGAVEAWFTAGGPGGVIFDQVMLAAADENFGTFGLPQPARLSRLAQMTSKITIYNSARDQVLELSASDIVNGVQRLGQTGPAGNPAVPAPTAAITTRVDCTGFNDYAYGFASSHQYYRLSPAVRADIVTRL